MKKLVVAILVIAFLAVAAAVAGTKVTRQPGSWLLAECGAEQDQCKFATEALCVAYAQAHLNAPMWTCTRHDRIYVEGMCDDIPAPKPFESETRNTLCPGTDADYLVEESYQRVDNDLYPVCWEVRWKVVAACPVTP